MAGDMVSGFNLGHLGYLDATALVGGGATGMEPAAGRGRNWRWRLAGDRSGRTTEARIGHRHRVE